MEIWKLYRIFLLMNKTAILGINAYHGGASAALVVDGQLVAAVEEERCSLGEHKGWSLEQRGNTVSIH